MTSKGMQNDSDLGDSKRIARSHLHSALRAIALNHTEHLVSAAQSLDAATADDLVFQRVWLAIGELARSEVLELDALHGVGLHAPIEKEKSTHE